MTKTEINCEVRIEWSCDGVAGTRTTDLVDIAPLTLPGYDSGLGEPYSGHETSLTFITPAGEWIWAAGRLWLPRALGCRSVHWIDRPTLAGALEVIRESLTGRSPEEIYDAA